MVGSAMARDLSGNHKVTLADYSLTAVKNTQSLDSSISALQLDVCDVNHLQTVAKPFDLVLTAVPGYLGFATLKALIEAGKNVVDISFFPENSLELNELAKTNGVTAIVDCGVAPGMDNFILGHYNEKYLIQEFECLVGGLPKNRKPPFEYKAPFSPIDVIEEYTRPARYMENGKIVTMPALTDIVSLEFDKLGTLESFNSDGLRSILFTMNHIPNMKEKTLRYPGHAAKMKFLSDAGLFNEDIRIIDGKEIRPIDLTSAILFDHWKLGKDEEELTVMRIRLKGRNGDADINIQYDLYDEYDPETGVSSMARTTGYTATAAVNLFLDGYFDEKGVFPPELIGGKDGCLAYILKYLSDRGVIYRKTVN